MQKKFIGIPGGYRDVNYEADICFDACSGFLHEQLSVNDLPSGGFNFNDFRRCNAPSGAR